MTAVFLFVSRLVGEGFSAEAERAIRITQSKPVKSEVRRRQIATAIQKVTVLYDCRGQMSLDSLREKLKGAVRRMELEPTKGRVLMHTEAPLEGLDQKGRGPVGQPVIFSRLLSVFFCLEGGCVRVRVKNESIELRTTVRLTLS